MNTVKKLTHSIEINASREKVWQVLWDDATYREWTSVFHEGSQAFSDWKEGSKILFSDATKKSGMVALIEKKSVPDTMIFKHLAELKDGVEIPFGQGSSHESYFLSEQNGKTTLRTELDAPETWVDYFNTTFPKALQKVKEIAER